MVRAAVGDRYVVEAMRKNGWTLGGEQSGHVIFLDQSTTGDGIVAALKVIEAMKRSGQKLSALKRQIKLYPQAREDVRVSRKEPLEKQGEVARAISAAEGLLSGRGRVFVRFSGTEPLARVLVEGENLAEIQNLSRSIASAIQKTLG